MGKAAEGNARDMAVLTIMMLSAAISAQPVAARGSRNRAVSRDLTTIVEQLSPREGVATPSRDERHRYHALPAADTPDEDDEGARLRLRGRKLKFSMPI
jgi:hypothetical protein